MKCQSMTPRSSAVVSLVVKMSSVRSSSVSQVVVDRDISRPACLGRGLDGELVLELQPRDAPRSSPVQRSRPWWPRLRIDRRASSSVFANVVMAKARL